MAKTTERTGDGGELPRTETPSRGTTTGDGVPGDPGRRGARPGETASVPAVDDSGVVAAYANFCRVTGTPEEVIVDLGVNSQPFGPVTEPVSVTQRIITNYYTAKRLVQILQMTVRRHEATFGVLETDVQKRAMRGPVSTVAPPSQP